MVLSIFGAVRAEAIFFANGQEMTPPSCLLVSNVLRYRSPVSYRPAESRHCRLPTGIVLSIYTNTDKPQAPRRCHLPGEQALERARWASEPGPGHRPLQQVCLLPGEAARPLLRGQLERSVPGGLLLAGKVQWELAVVASTRRPVCEVGSPLAAWPWVAEAAPRIPGLRRGCLYQAAGRGGRRRGDTTAMPRLLLLLLPKVPSRTARG